MKTHISLLFLCISYLTSCSSSDRASNFADHNKTPFTHIIPGKLQCELYDAGGEGISFHDSDAINSGSGGLNKGSDYFSTFRINEAVDISFTKYIDNTDNSEFNFVEQQEHQLYVGWTAPGEWIKYTVDVAESGNYQVGLMFTSRHGGVVRLSAGKGAQVDLQVPTTYDPEDPLDWRQWHHWNYLDNLGTIHLKKGRQVITLSTIEKGEMNYDYINFTLQ